MATVFITGGAGFIGSRLAHIFLDYGNHVIIFDTFKQYILPDPEDKKVPNLFIRLRDIIHKIELVQGDILEKDYLRRTIIRVKPDIIIHMAALPLASIAIEHSGEAYQSILASTVNFLEIIRDFEHPCRFVYTSSSMVYGNFTTEQITEDSTKDPKEIYGSYKLAGEIISRGFMKCYGLDIVIVRPSAVYGPYDANQRVIQKFITSALNGETINVDGDGSVKLDFTYVDDISQGLFLAATHSAAKGETFNITRGRARSLNEVLQLIQEKIPTLKIEYRSMPAYMPKRGTLDINKARTLLGYKPNWDLEQAIPSYIEHLRHNSI